MGDRDRSEAGGLQYTAQQLGSSLGTALIGAVVIAALITLGALLATGCLPTRRFEELESDPDPPGAEPAAPRS